MPHICTIHKQLDNVNSELAKKIRLERIFLPEVRSIFAQMLRDYKTTVLALGRSPDASQYQPRWRSSLQKQYDRVQTAFKGEIIDQNGGKALFHLLVKQDSDKADALTGLALLEWRNNNSDKKADMITRTNQAQMDQAIIDARQMLQDQEQDINPATVAVTATVLLKRKFGFRSNVIAQTETQESAEATKQIEASVLAGASPFALRDPVAVPVDEPKDVTKTWKDMDDSRVRPSHSAVDLTTVNEDGIFFVGSSRLRFPGDTSLLASAGETINCRCEARYKLI